MEDINSGVFIVVAVVAIVVWRVLSARKAGTGIRGVFGMPPRGGTTKRK